MNIVLDGSVVDINHLRFCYSKIERVDPDGEAYKGVCSLLDSLDDDKLKLLASAGIKWISVLARNRCIKRGLSLA